MCTTGEVFATLSFPEGIAGVAWVVQDPAILTGIGGNCGGWVSNNANQNGSVVVLNSTTSQIAPSPYNGFAAEVCNVALPVACCALVP